MLTRYDISFKYVSGKCFGEEGSFYAYDACVTLQLVPVVKERCL